MVKYIFSLIAGAVLAYFRLYSVAFIFIAVVACIDIVTGIAASVIDGSGLSSAKAFKGVIKKLILFVTLAFGTFLDVFIPYAAKTVNLSLPESLLFSTVICVYITVCESISVAENIYRCDNSILPVWVLGVLRRAKDDLDRKEGEGHE